MNLRSQKRRNNIFKDDSTTPLLLYAWARTLAQAYASSVQQESKMIKETVGKQLFDKLMKEKPESVPVMVMSEAMNENHMPELLLCVDRSYACFMGDFYIEVLKKREKALGTVFRTYFNPRSTCPTPMFDQDVYKYDKTKGSLDYLWSVPDKDTCYYLRDNIQYVVPEERMLLSYVISYFDGSLLKVCKKLNGESLEAGVSLQ
jgi:hypothetical protein